MKSGQITADRKKYIWENGLLYYFCLSGICFEWMDSISKIMFGNA